MSEQGALFDVVGLQAPATPTARRRVAEGRVIGLGLHPLTGGRLHPEADPRSTSAPRCGTCRFRRPVERHTSAPAPKVYPKCWRFPEKITRGPGSDVLASWPACVEWQAKGQE